MGLPRACVSRAAVIETADCRVSENPARINSAARRIEFVWLEAGNPAGDHEVGLKA